jgi:hypothetical protein
VVFWVVFINSQEPDTREDGGNAPVDTKRSAGDDRSRGYWSEGVRVPAQVYLLGFCPWDGLYRRDGDTGRLWKGKCVVDN